MSNKDLYREYLTKYSTITIAQLAKKIKDENPNQKASELSIKISLHKIAKEDSESVTVDIDQQQQKWSVIDETYYWKAARGQISISVEQIDNLFYAYSEHGQNQTQTQILNKFGLKVWEWNSIKNTLQLYKKSNIFSPHTVDITPPQQLGQMIQEKIAVMFSNIGEQVETKYNQELNRAYKKAVVEVEEWQVRKKILLTELADIVPQITRDAQPALRVSANADGVISLFISDVHFGAESRTASIGPYSPDITKQQFAEIAEEVNRIHASEVHVFFVGDNIESATGLNHIDSWKGLAKGYYGSYLMIEAYKAYVVFLSSINNLKKIYAVPGNHDRMTPSNKDDAQGFLAEMLFEMIRLAFNNTLEVAYNEKIITVSIDGLHYIMSHGHLRLTDASPAELILEYGDPYKFNILISGHWHNRKVRKDHRNFRQLVCPSIFPGNDYSQNLGVSSIPGYLLIRSKNGKPIVLDYPL